MEKQAAPKGVKDKALWDKIEKSVLEYGKYHGDQIYKVVTDAYQKAGGTYTHESDKKSSAVIELMKVGEKMASKYIK
jgi:hypothetical protein